jgi:hypothetical protein
MIQLRHVPDALHRTLKVRAALEGLTLSGRHAAPSGTRGACRAASRVIVVDASAILEVLLNSVEPRESAKR